MGVTFEHAKDLNFHFQILGLGSGLFLIHPSYLEHLLNTAAVLATKADRPTHYFQCCSVGIQLCSCAGLVSCLLLLAPWFLMCMILSQV